MNKVSSIIFTVVILLLGVYLSTMYDQHLSDNLKLGLGFALAILVVVIVLLISVTGFYKIFNDHKHRKILYLNSIWKIVYWIIIPPIIVAMLSVFVIGIVLLTGG